MIAEKMFLFYVCRRMAKIIKDGTEAGVGLRIDFDKWRIEESEPEQDEQEDINEKINVCYFPICGLL